MLLQLQLLPTLSLFLLYGQATQLHCQVYVSEFFYSVEFNREKKPTLEDNAWITLHFHSPGFQNYTRRLTQTSFHKNYKLGPTYSRLAIFSLRELHQTNQSTLRAETSSRYQSFLPENQIWHTRRSRGASLACYQPTLICEMSFFSQWYFPSFRRSTNEILWEIVASSPFLCPSQLRRSLARSRETRFTRPNRRACSQAKISYIL